MWNFRLKRTGSREYCYVFRLKGRGDILGCWNFVSGVLIPPPTVDEDDDVWIAGGFGAFS